jgi:adenylate cyclase
VTPGSRVAFFDETNRLIAASDTSASFERAETFVQSLKHTDRATAAVTLDGHDYLVGASWISGIPLLKGGHVTTITPLEDLTGPSREVLHRGLLTSAVIVAAGIGVALLVAASVGRSLAGITREARQIQEFELDGGKETASHIAEISQLAAAVAAARGAIATFALYVPRELVRKIVASGEGAGRFGHRQVVTALFTDIKDFTTISERNSAEDVVSALSLYFDLVSDVVQKHNGTIIQYSGDSVFVLWNAPLPDDLHCDRACRCALDLCGRIDTFNASQRDSGAPEFVTRFGIHTGAVVVGNVGARDRIQYTAMGDVVNVASRLEGLNKDFATTVLVSAEVTAGVRSELSFRPLGQVRVKGRGEQLQVFELVA